MVRTICRQQTLCAPGGNQQYPYSLRPTERHDTASQQWNWSDRPLFTIALSGSKGRVAKFMDAIVQATEQRTAYPAALFMNAASCTSSSVTPPALWVARVTSTRL